MSDQTTPRPAYVAKKQAEMNHQATPHHAYVARDEELEPSTDSLPNYGIEIIRKSRLAAKQACKERDEALARLHPDRALEWLRVHYQAWFGDRKNWSEDIADRFYRDTATLTLFCQNFKFSKEAAE
jgi:hypothetical protein